TSRRSPARKESDKSCFLLSFFLTVSIFRALHVLFLNFMGLLPTFNFLPSYFAKDAMESYIGLHKKNARVIKDVELDDSIKQKIISAFKARYRGGVRYLGDGELRTSNNRDPENNSFETGCIIKVGFTSNKRDSTSLSYRCENFSRSHIQSEMDFCLWGTLKNSVYATKPQTLEQQSRRYVALFDMLET
ncbi:hypothetical protein L9F63_005299, partial [Diploptera punctata]